MNAPHYHVWRLPDKTWLPTHDWDFAPPITLPPRDDASPCVPPSQSLTLSPPPPCPGQGLGWCDCPPDPDENEPPP